MVDPVWLLASAVSTSAFCVLSFEALEEFSFSDAEELLRKAGRAKRDLPRLESFAEQIRDHQFRFRVIDYAGRAVTFIALWEVLPQEDSLAHWLFFGLGFLLHLSLLDLVVRQFAARHPEWLTLWLLRPWQVFHLILWVPLLPIRLFTEGLQRLLNSRHPEEDPEAQAEDDILAVVSQGEYAGQIDEEERDMIESVLGLGDLTVDKLMTPRTEMHAVDIEAGADGVLREALETGHSRLPVFEDNRDNIIGICYVKDLLGLPPDDLPDLRSILRSPVLVPASKNVVELMRELRRERIHLAVVLDEYGGTAGLITVEDIIEEVFGDIDDEYDQVEEDEVRNLDDSTIDLDARMHVDEVNERFNVNLPESERYESLGGLVTSELGCIPGAGDAWENEHLRLTVLEATERRVIRLRLEELDGLTNRAGA